MKWHQFLRYDAPYLKMQFRHSTTNKDWNPVCFPLTVKYFVGTVSCHIRHDIYFSRQRFRQCYMEMLSSSSLIYMRTSVTDVWKYETDDALEEYLLLGKDEAEMRLSSHKGEAAAEDTWVVTRVINVNHTCTLNFQESRAFWDSSPYISVNAQAATFWWHPIHPSPRDEDGGNRDVQIIRANTVFIFLHRRKTQHCHILVDVGVCWYPPNYRTTQGHTFEDRSI